VRRPATGSGQGALCRLALGVAVRADQQSHKLSHGGGPGGGDQRLQGGQAQGSVGPLGKFQQLRRRGRVTASADRTDQFQPDGWLALGKEIEDRLVDPGAMQAGQRLPGRLLLVALDVGCDRGQGRHGRGVADRA